MSDLDIVKQLQRIEKELRATLGDKGLEPMAQHIIEDAGRNVQDEVYDIYEPVQYKRTGALKRNWVPHYYDPLTLGVSSERWDGEYRYVSRVVEEGEDYIYQGREAPLPYEYPRPFFEALYAEYLLTGKHVLMLSEILEDKGIKNNPLKFGSIDLR